MQEKFGDNFDAKVVSWTEQTKETEMTFRFLEEVKNQGFQVMNNDGVSNSFEWPKRRSFEPQFASIASVHVLNLRYEGKPQFKKLIP